MAEWSRVTGSYDRVRVPTLNTTGWYDIFAQGALDNYAAMAERGVEVTGRVRIVLHAVSSAPRDGLGGPLV